MKLHAALLVVTFLFTYASAEAATSAEPSLQETQAICNKARSSTSNSFKQIEIKSMLSNLNALDNLNNQRSNNFSSAPDLFDVDTRIMSLSSNKPTAVEAECLNSARALVTALKAEVKKREQQEQASYQQRRQQETSTQREMQERLTGLQEKIQHGDASFDLVQQECQAGGRSSSRDAATNDSFQRLLELVQKGDIDSAGEQASNLLGYHLQDVTDGQQVCATLVGDFAQAQNRQIAKQPPNQLKNVYKHYMAMQACFESRKEFRVQYVSKQEMDAARTITKRDEQALLKQFPVLAKQKDTLWELAKQEYGASDFATVLRANGTTHSKTADQSCKVIAMKYTIDKEHQQQQIKKDF